MVVGADDETAPGLDAEAPTVAGQRRRQSVRPVGPAVVGRFSILSFLGAGGMGAVYAAYDERLDRKVALKLLEREVDDVARGRMLREAQALAKVDHPNVVKVYEAGEHAQQLYIAMEFVDGEHLMQWAQSADPSWPDVLSVYRRAGQGLAAAHAVGLVHRDFKPHNAMVDAGTGEGTSIAARRVRVLDFGLAGRPGARADEGVEEGLETTAPRRTVGSGNSFSTPLTQTGAVMGTPAYMAPEQVAGELATAKSDQFSFCVALWEALYGVRPFAGDSALEVMTALSAGRRREPPPGKVIPSWLSQALDRGLSDAPEDRFDDMAALLAALDRTSRRQQVLRWGVPFAALTGAAAFALSVPAAPDACTDAATDITRAWGPDRRTALQERLSEVDAEFAVEATQSTIALLDDYADVWADGRREACTAALVRHEQSTEVMLQRVRCLDDGLRAFEALVEVLESPDRPRLAAAPRTAAA
ncbi:MAG: serine/threonine-protein kinase, partial [Myxococcota bacterium]